MAWIDYIPLVNTFLFALTLASFFVFHLRILSHASAARDEIDDRIDQVRLRLASLERALARQFHLDRTPAPK